MTKKSYMPRWLDLRDEIADSIGLLNGHVSDLKTIHVLNNVTRTLMNKQALPDGLKKTFIENIRRRTRHTGFIYDGEIRLTVDQVKYAKQRGRGEMIPLPVAQSIPPAFPPANEAAELLEAFQRYFLLIATHFPPDSPHISTNLGSKTAELLEFWWRNEIKSTEINHDGTMTCPLDEMRLASSPDIHDFANDDHEPAAAGFPQARGIIENHDGREGTMVPAPVVALPRRKRRPEIAISYFHNNPAQAPSAMFEFGDEKYSLLFATADHAEERLRSVSDPEWIDWLEQSGGSDIRDRSRATSKTGHVSRYVMSPLYAANDKRGYKPPVVENCVVVLCWEEDAPVIAILIAGQTICPIDLGRFSNGEGKKPLFKGRAAMPVQDEDTPAMAA